MGRTYELEDHVGFGAAQRQVADFVDDEQGWPQVGLELAVELGVPGTGVPSWESKRPGMASRTSIPGAPAPRYPPRSAPLPPPKPS